MTSRTTTSAARTAPAAAVASDSTARRAPSARTPCRPPSAAPAGAPSRTPPRSPCSNERRGRLPGSPPRAGGTSVRCGRRRRRRRPAGSAGTAPARRERLRAFFSTNDQSSSNSSTGSLDLKQRRGECGQFGYLFLSHAVTVWRETPQVRESPRKELRSSSARRICSRSSAL
jgi:hypothetical protein